MHKRMRRGKEMYPSFDTRRVLCKQQRPYCVKPFGAYLSHRAALSAEQPFLSNTAENIAMGVANKSGAKETGLIDRQTMIVFAKGNVNGIKRDMLQKLTCANAKSAEANTPLPIRLALFVRTNASA